MLHPLTTTKAGEEVIIRCFACTCEDTCRLNDLGCVEGINGRVLSNQSNIILQIGESRLAIQESLAKTILVSLAQ